MKFLAFLAVVLLSGAIAGTVQGMANLVLVEPVLDKAIYLENKALFDSGAEQDSIEFRVAHEEYRVWQKGGQLVSSAILGMSMGSLFGLVFGYARKSLPSSNILKKTLILAVIMWLILFIIPFVKYPSNPPTVGDSNTVSERATLYVGLIAVSGLLTLGFYYASRFLHGQKKVLALVGYLCILCTVIIMFPENPDAVSISDELLYDFRVASVISVTIFWITLAFVFGGLWRKFIPSIADSVEK